MKQEEQMDCKISECQAGNDPPHDVIKCINYTVQQN